MRGKAGGDLMCPLDSLQGNARGVQKVFEAVQEFKGIDLSSSEDC